MSIFEKKENIFGKIQFSIVQQSNNRPSIFTTLHGKTTKERIKTHFLPQGVDKWSRWTFREN